ncbi:MAG: FG-GAP repeat domain-containing protein, partial [Candidatus Heimdallarchaeaceae archaeon]
MEQKKLKFVIILIMILVSITYKHSLMPSVKTSPSTIKTVITNPTLEWSFPTADIIVSSPVAADVNGDGLLEVLFTS